MIQGKRGGLVQIQITHRQFFVDNKIIIFLILSTQNLPRMCYLIFNLNAIHTSSHDFAASSRRVFALFKGICSGEGASLASPADLVVGDCVTPLKPKS